MCMSTIERLEKLIKELQANRDYWKRLYEEAICFIDTLRANRDRLQKRVEALESAIKNNACEPCDFCVNSERRGHVDICDDCVVWCGCPGAPDKWEFNEQRYMKQGEI